MKFLRVYDTLNRAIDEAKRFYNVNKNGNANISFDGTYSMNIKIICENNEYTYIGKGCLHTIRGIIFDEIENYTTGDDIPSEILAELKK